MKRKPYTCKHGNDESDCPECKTHHLTKKTPYTEADRNLWMRTALGNLAPAGTWPSQLFQDMWHAKNPAEAVKIAMNARERFEALWGAWDK